MEWKFVHGQNLIRVVTIAAIVGASTLAPAQSLRGENLLTGVPDGFKAGHSASDGKTDLLEFVPSGETVDDWSLMVTITTRRGVRNTDPEDRSKQLAVLWTQACTGGEALSVQQGEENGYPFSMWLYVCPLNSQTGKPETMLSKYISGADALYNVQYAARAEPDKALIVKASQYLSRAQVCDTRRPDRSCPSGM